MSRRSWSLGKLASTWSRRNAGGDDSLLHSSILSDMVGEKAVTRVTDAKRAPSPSERPVAGAQWNEITGRWERWDAATNDWVAVPDDPTDEVPPAG